MRGTVCRAMRRTIYRGGAQRGTAYLAEGVLKKRLVDPRRCVGPRAVYRRLKQVYRLARRQRG